MGRIAKIKRLLIEDANKRLLEQSDSEERIGKLKSDILHLSNHDMDEIIEKIHKDEKLKHSLSLDIHSDEKSIMDSLAHNVHAHYNPHSKHLSLQFPHLGKHHDIKLDLEGSLGHHDSHHNTPTIPSSVISAGVTIPLSFNSAH
tara:strand:- start:71 stop:502 length:432 start_codon:yes stop_codon:yes gene_type:complete